MSLQLVRNPGLLQDSVCSVSRRYGRRNREVFARDRAMPNFMATLPLSDERAVVTAQQRSQLRIEPAAHGSHRDKVLVVAFVEVEMQPQLLDRDVVPILMGHLGGNLPHTGANSVQGHIFRDDAEVITDSSEHPGFLVEGDMNSEGNWELDYVCHQVHGTHNLDIADSGKQVYGNCTSILTALGDPK